MPYNLDLYNDALYNQSAAAAAALAAQGRRFYTIEILNGSHTLLRRLPKWGIATYTQRLNGLPTLRFTYPWDTEVVDLFTFPNLFALRDRAGNLLDRFNLATKGKRRTVNGQRFLELMGEGVLSQLSHEWITSYEASAAQSPETTFSEILGEFQINGVVRPIIMGPWAGAISSQSRKFKVENISILAALHEMRRQVGGYFFVDPLHRLRWVQNISGTDGQEIRIGKNLPGLEVDEDFRTITTRLHGKGHGIDDDGRLTYTADSDNQGTFGIWPKTYEAQTVREIDQLVEMVDSRLEEVKIADKKLRADIIDLSEVDSDLDYSHEALIIGSQVRLIDGDLDETLDVHILGISRNLAQPAQVRIQISDTTTSPLYGGKQDDIVDVLADILEALNERATQDWGLREFVQAALPSMMSTLMGRCPEARLDADINATALLLDMRQTGRQDLPTTTNVIVVGSDGKDYRCILAHTSASANKPITGGSYTTFWVDNSTTGQGETWVDGIDYTVTRPFQLRLSLSAFFGDGELVTVSSVSGNTYTLSSRGDTGGVDAQAWLAGAERLVKGTDGLDYICTVPHLSAAGNKPITGGSFGDVWKQNNTIGGGATWGSGTRYGTGIASIVVGSDGKDYRCIQTHTSATANDKPITGTNFADFWVDNGTRDEGDAWADSTVYAVGDTQLRVEVVRDPVLCGIVTTDNINNPSNSGGLVGGSADALPEVITPGGSSVRGSSAVAAPFDHEHGLASERGTGILNTSDVNSDGAGDEWAAVTHRHKAVWNEHNP